VRGRLVLGALFFFLPGNGTAASRTHPGSLKLFQAAWVRQTPACAAAIGGAIFAILAPFAAPRPIGSLKRRGARNQRNTERNMFGKAGLGGLMQQAQKMQENMKKAQAELAETEVEGQAGNGLVKVVMTCGHQVRKLDISSELIEQAADDKELLEDLLLAAFADAGAKVAQTTSDKMSKFTQGLPPGMGDFFK
jgi:DNA-binding protein, ybaB/ebfC family